jgi:uncharacterized membrane protein
MSTIDERFTDLADIISEKMGRWWVSVVSALLIITWTLYCMFTQGPGWWYGIFYNLPLNLVTTIAELFIGFLIAAAANRVERRHELLLREIKGHTRADEATTKRDAEVNKKSEEEIAALREDIRAIKEAVLK